MRRASQTHRESSVSTRLQPRLRDEKKLTESSSKQKSAADDAMDTAKASNPEDVYEFKSVKESESSPEQKSSDPLEMDVECNEGGSQSIQADDNTKRNLSELAEGMEEGTDEESKRKKRKEEVSGKDSKPTPTARSASQNKGQGNKQSSSVQAKANIASTKPSAVDKKSPCSSPKPLSDAEEEGKTDLKVPPLKIVIPQTSTKEEETGQSRNGKSSSQRHSQALPYVVASSNSTGGDSNEKDAASGTTSPTENSGKQEEKKEGTLAGGGEDQRTGSGHQRVLRSSHRSGPAQGSVDRSSNNSSPQLQRSHSPSPLASPAPPSQSDSPATTTQSSTAGSAAKASDSQASNNSDTELQTASTSSNTVTTPAAVELHPRKRKMKTNKELSVPTPSHDVPEQPSVSEIHPHDQPITNCYQLYLNIRKQIEKRRKGLFPVQPKPPQGFKDYLMNRCTYVLASTTSTTPNISYPAGLASQMKDLFTEQEKERYRLRMQHVIEKEKLVLSVEQEILRVHGRAARALAYQSLPFSVCTILRDEEVYNLITPEQEEKDRNARSRYNGRLFLSWLQDVDDKWEKIKEHMLLRHHNEAESLHAVQKMDWEWKMKELSLCDAKSTPTIDDVLVPMVHVSDDFDLLPA